MTTTINLTGRYELDRERSQSLYPHMKALGCDEIAALASEKLHITVDIIQSKTELHIWQTSQLGETKRVLSLTDYTNESDTRKAKVTLIGHNKIIIATTFPQGDIVDSRTLDEDGEVMSQVIELRLSNNSAEEPPIRTERYMKKLGPPAPVADAMPEVEAA